MPKTCCLIGALYGIAKLIGASAHYFAQRAELNYNKELHAYNVSLNECTSKIPEQTQAIAGYLATIKNPVQINLPSTFIAPVFKGNPDKITLPEIKNAVDASYVINQIKVPDQPFGFWTFAFGIPFSICAPLCIIGNIVCNSDNFFPFCSKYLVACRIAIVKPSDKLFTPH